MDHDAIRREMQAENSAQRAALDRYATTVNQLRAPFRHVDVSDWEWLDGRLGRTGQAEFWRSVIREIRNAPAPTGEKP